jgi:hypothetical protein
MELKILPAAAKELDVGFEWNAAGARGNRSCIRKW